MSIIIAVGVAMIGLLSTSKLKSFAPKLIFGALTLVLVLVSFISIQQRDELFLQIPFTRIDNDEVLEVASDGSFYLDSSQTVAGENKFYLTSDNRSEMTSWLQSTTKNINVCIANGTKTVYRKNFGRYSDGLENEIWSIYTQWKSDGVVPSTGTKYWFMFFYYEV